MMSSMGQNMNYRILVIRLLTGAAALASGGAVMAQDGASWDRARTNLVAQGPGRMAAAIERWEYLTARDNLGFSDYANFVSTYSDFPKTETLQRRAEAALDRDTPAPEQLVAFFDQPPAPDQFGARTIRSRAGDAKSARGAGSFARRVAWGLDEWPGRGLPCRVVWRAVQR